MDLKLHQVDLKTAFLSGDLDEDIFMEVLDGVKTKSKQNIVSKLNKSLYGTKQARWCWNLKMNGFLCEELGFERDTSDPCFYVKKSSFGHLRMLTLYLKDLLIAASSIDDINGIKRKSGIRFDIRDSGEAKVCLGLVIKRNREKNTFFRSQKSHKVDILKRFGMSECRPVVTPMETLGKSGTLVECSFRDPNSPAVSVPYREATG